MMESSIDLSRSRSEILNDVEVIVSRFQASPTALVTKSQQQQAERDRVMVEGAAARGAEGVVKDLGALQLHIDSSLVGLAGSMRAEVEKLAELERAVAIEGARLVKLGELLVVAEALELERRDHARARAELEGEQAEALVDLANQRAAEERETSQREARADAETTRQREQAAQERAAVEDERQWSLGRRRQSLADERAVARQALTRELAEEQALHDKDWQRRRAELEAADEELKSLRAKVEAEPAELEAAKKKARDEAIARAQRKTKLEGELQTKENQASAELRKLEIEGLESRIESQARRIVELTTQLGAAFEQSQKLAARALDSKTDQAA